MPRPNRGKEGLMGGPCKIRKRGCSSSSSSSSALQNGRFKRAILVGKRGGSSTPVPTWKMSSLSPASMADPSESPKYQPSMAGGKAKQGPVSARKLAATLWELNEIPSPRMKEDLRDRSAKRDTKGMNQGARPARLGSLPPHLSDPSHSPVSGTTDRSGTGTRRGRVSPATQRIRSSDPKVGLESVSGGSFMEVETQSRGLTPSGSVVGAKSRLRDVCTGLTTSKELVKILNRVWGLEDQRSSSISLIQALHVELEQARMQVDKLFQDQKSNQDEVHYLMKRFAEAKASWKIKEQEKVRAAIQSTAGDLEMEKKLRRKAESLNVKLGRELGETKMALSKALKELEGEKRSREIMEQVCEELARGIGDDKAQVEEFKRESAKVWEEVEKEREMLQLADVWREERVQMKLSEAKFQFEEKNAAVDKLRHELEEFLNTKRTNETHIGPRSSDQGSEEDQGEEDDGEVDEEEDDSGESDLHSIELNMDNSFMGCRWSNTQGMEKRASAEEEKERRKSTSEQNVRHHPNRSLSEGIEWEFSMDNYQNGGNWLKQGRLFESDELAEKKGKKEDSSNKPLKGINDHRLSSSTIGSSPGYASATRQEVQRGSCNSS